MKIYKVLKGYYSGVKEEEIIIPKNMKLLYNNGAIGHGLHDGHNHYLGCMKKSELPKEATLYYEFDDLVFLIFDNIKFIDESPEFYTPEEFMNEFKLSEYYIEFQTEGYFKDVNLDINSFETNKELLIYLKDNYVKAKTYEICKITNIEGHYSVTVFTVTNAVKYNSDELFNICEDKRIHVANICMADNKIIYKNDDSMFKEMINNVLKRANYERVKN